MKKIFSRVVPVAVLLAAFGLVLAGCSTDGNTGPARYTGKDRSGNTYELVINDPPRADEGDTLYYTYILTVTNSSGRVIARSTGRVMNSSSDFFSLISDTGDYITINISSGAISTISGTISGVGENSPITSPIVVPPTNTPSTSLSGKTYWSPTGGTLYFYDSTFSIGLGLCRGTYSVSGSTVTLTLTWVSADFKEYYANKDVGSKLIGTISSNGDLIIEGQTWTEEAIDTIAIPMYDTYFSPDRKKRLDFSFQSRNFTMIILEDETEAYKGIWEFGNRGVSLTLTWVSDAFAPGNNVGDKITGTLSSNGDLIINGETWTALGYAISNPGTSNGLSGNVYWSPTGGNLYFYDSTSFSIGDFSIGLGLCRGTYSVSGSTVTLTLTWVSADFKEYYANKDVGSKLIGTLSNYSSVDEELFIEGQTWMRER